MNELAIFKSPEFGQLEVVLVNEAPHVAATECARMLGYVKPQNAIARHCRYSLKRGVPHPQSPSKQIEKIFIPESDVLRLIVGAADQSQNPLIKAKAERFEKWVFDEVIPLAMRTNGQLPEQQASVLNTDPKHMRAEALLMNARTRNAALLVRMAADKRLSNNLVEILTVEAAQVCTGRRIPDGILANPRLEQMTLPEPPPMPPIPTAPYTPPKPAPEKSEPHYTATEIAGAAGVRAAMVGVMANKHGLKTAPYGKFKRIYNRFSGGEVDCFFYNERGREKLLVLLKAK